MTSDHSPRPTAREAQQALDSITESKKAVAPFVRSPKWLYPVQGMGMGLFIIGLVFAKENTWGLAVLTATCILFSLLPMFQARRRVVMDVYTHRGSRGLGVVYLASFALITIAALALYSLFASAWLVAGAAVLALVLTLVAGPAMDARLEQAVRDGR